MRKCYLFVAVVAFFAVFTATALGWHADDVSVEAICQDNTYLVFASIDQSEEWPDAYVISITPSSFAGSTSGEQGVTVVIGWDTGETQTFNKSVRLDGECAEPEEEHKTSLCHATGNSDTFPAKKYVLIPPSEAGAVFGHLGDSHQNGNDIIPPFEFEGTTYSQHWDAVGQAIFAAGCEVEEEEEPPTDVCPNLEGNQESIPEGMIKDGQGNCVVPPVIIVPPVVVEPPTGCPDGLPANAGKDGEAGNDDCKRTPPVVTPPVITPPVVNPPVVNPPVVTPPVVTPPTAQPPKPKPPVFKPPKSNAPAVCV